MLGIVIVFGAEALAVMLSSPARPKWPSGSRPSRPPAPEPWTSRTTSSGGSSASSATWPRGIHPPVLADRGLEAALQSLANSTPMKVTLSVDVEERPAPTVETAAYFVAAEALANAGKRARAKRLDIMIARTDDLLDLGWRMTGSVAPTRRAAACADCGAESRRSTGPSA